MNRILIVEDELSIREMVQLCLTKNGYKADIAENGTAAADRLESQSYDLILLDIMLPDVSGFDLIGYIRQFGIPVIFVTAKASVTDRVKGLRLGADDYLVKPFDLQELLARVEAVLRRCHKTENVFQFGAVRVDTLSHSVYLHDELVRLTAKEYDLFLYLIRNKNIALYREQIYEQVWKEPYLGNTRTVDLHIQRLKKKLHLEQAIETVYTVGYRFIPEKLL